MAKNTGQKKSARIRETPAQFKRARSLPSGIAFVPKTIRSVSDLQTDSGNRYPSWRFSSMDIDGPWCPKRMQVDHFWFAVQPRLRNLETMTWSEIKQGTRSHFVAVQKLSPEAKKRLEDIQKDDIDYLFSLRLRGKPRLWGLLLNGVFDILWWDPEHEVCPSLPD